MNSKLLTPITAADKMAEEKEIETDSADFNEDGYWAGEGNAASGILAVARDSKKLCLAWRSINVHTGDCWGTIGGAVKDGLTPAASAKAEMKEEVGYAGGIELHAGYIFKDGSFSYHNFVGVVDSEFEFNPAASHAWETDYITWMRLDEIEKDIEENPGDYHPELINFFKKSHAVIHGLVDGDKKAASTSQSESTKEWEHLPEDTSEQKALKSILLTAAAAAAASTLYRVAPTSELQHRDFAAVFFSTDRAMAAQYHSNVFEYEADLAGEELLSIDDPGTPGMVAEYTATPPEDAADIEDITPELFMFPDAEWVAFLEKRGYTGTRIGKDLALFGDVASRVHLATDKTASTIDPEADMAPKIADDYRAQGLNVDVRETYSTIRVISLKPPALHPEMAEEFMSELTEYAERVDKKIFIVPGVFYEAANSDGISTTEKVAFIGDDLGYLKSYLTMSKRDMGEELARGFFPDFLSFMEDNYPEELEALPFDDEERDYLDDFSSVPEAALQEFLDSEGHTAMQQDPAHAPLFLHAEYESIVKNQWLIHFTDDANAVANEGFRYGISDMAHLGLTTSFTQKAKEFGGYNFAYLLSDFERYGFDRGTPRYGKNCVIFRASGVKVHHYGDEEPQVIFWGKDARDIIPVYREDGNWNLPNGDSDRPLFKSEELGKVAEWVVDHFAQYRKPLLAKTSAGKSITTTPAFKAWFSGSKVVNRAGRPLVVYHGSKAKFDEFKPTESSRYTTFSEEKVTAPGHFFSANKEFAKSFGPNLGAYYLRIRKPLLNGDEASLGYDHSLPDAKLKELAYILEPMICDKYISWDTGENVKMFVLEPSAYNVDEDNQWVYEAIGSQGIKWGVVDNSQVVARMREKGYDGSWVDEDRGNGEEDLTFFVMNSNQIKSATENSGAFDPQSNKVTASMECAACESGDCFLHKIAILSKNPSGKPDANYLEGSNGWALFPDQRAGAYIPAPVEDMATKAEEDGMTPEEVWVNKV